MINVFKSFRAVRIAEKANKSNEEIVETSCNLIFKKIEKAAKRGCYTLSVGDSEREMRVTEQQRQKIIQILKEAGYKAKYVPPHDSYDNHGVAWATEEGYLLISWAQEFVDICGEPCDFYDPYGTDNPEE